MERCTIPILVVCLLLSLAGLEAHAQSGLRINELLASTEAEDELETSLEWVELLNDGSETISLRGYSLSDDPESPRKWFLPTVSLAPQTPFLVYTTGYNWFRNGDYHSNFQLDREGEWIGLFDPDGMLIDEIRYPAQVRDLSYGRSRTADSEWGFFEDPTPVQSNGRETLSGLASPPSLSVPGGVYPGAVQVEISASPGLDIRFTLDGTTPTEDSALYSTPLTIRRNSPLRVRTFGDRLLPSRTQTHSFIIRDDTPLPIVSLVTDPDHLWDSNQGIYANSTRHGRVWERPCSFEWIDTEGLRTFGVDCGIRIHGGASRQRSFKKSWRLYFRNEYGPVLLEHALFDHTPATSFNQLVIRGNFNDAWAYDREMQRVTVLNVRDQTVRWIFQDMGQPVADGHFAMLYINGEYWGIYNPCERYDELFMQHRFGGDEWDIIVEDLLREGDMTAYMELQQWIRSNDMRDPENYAEAWRRIDLENFTDYMLINIWMQNYDWPHHNWYAARMKDPTASWRFFVWDIEYSFGSGIQGYRIDQNTMNNATDLSRGSIPLIFTELLKNRDYRHYVWRRYEYHRNNALSESHIRTRLDQSLERVMPVIPAELERWGGGDKTMEDFEDARQKAYRFIEERSEHVVRFMRQELGPPPVSVMEWSVY